MALMSNLPALGEGEEVDPQATALAYFIDKGYTPQQAAGIVGNLISESGPGLNTTAVHDKGTGFGIAGFRDPTPGQGRKTNLLNFAKGSGADPRDLFTQLDFVHKELQGSEGAANRNLLRASDPAAAATAFAGYERPQGWSAANPMGAHRIQDRIGNAQALAPLAGQLATAGEGQEIEVNDAPVGGRAFAAGKGIMGGSGAISGSSGSDTLTGSGGSDRFTGGLASKPYQPADEGSGVGDIISAIGLSMMSGKRGNLLGNLPTILTAQEKEKARREDRRYGMWRDERNYDVGRADAAQAQANAEAARALTVRGLDTADKNSAFSQNLQTNADKRAAEAAAKGETKSLADGSTVRINDDNTVTQLTPPIKSAESTDLIKNFAQAKKDGYTGNFVDYQRAIKGGAALDAGDKKAIMAADDQVTNNTTVIGNLKLAKELSKQAYGFPGAGQVGAWMGALGSESGKATTKLDNVVTGSALSQLKTIFGGNPTEGERKILLDIEGSSSKPDDVRQDIYDRAIEAAQARIATNKDRAQKLRSGTYYQPGAPSQPATGGFDLTTVPEDARRAEARRRGLIQ